MTHCQIFVINIFESSDRRKNISLQLDTLGVPFEIFPAIDGRKLTYQLFDKYSNETRMRVKGTPLSRGQLGCYASHYLLWEQCVSNNRPMIVLEDDARIFSDSFMDFYRNADRVEDRYECIRLFESYGKKRKGIKVGDVGGLGVFKYMKGYMGTIGYYLTPPGAKKFLEGSKEWFLTVDIYMDRFWANKVEYYGVVPACLDFDPKFSSDIDYIQHKEKRSMATRVRRELFTTSEAMRRLCWNLRFRWKHFFAKRAGL